MNLSHEWIIIIYIKPCDMMTYPCLNFNGAWLNHSAKAPLKSGHEWIITPALKRWRLLSSALFLEIWLTDIVFVFAEYEVGNHLIEFPQLWFGRKRKNHKIIVLYVVNYFVAAGRFRLNFRYVIFKLSVVIYGWAISCEIAHKTSLALTDDKSILVQITVCAVRQQAITWTNVDQDQCRHMASSSHNDLTWKIFAFL